MTDATKPPVYSDWRPIDDVAKNGNAQVVWAIHWGEWTILHWKTNPRTGRSYFGNWEWDDYDQADDQPSHYLPIALPGEPIK